MHKTIEEQNAYIELLVRMRRQETEWLGAAAQDHAEAEIRHNWSVYPPTPWRIKSQRQIQAWREEIAACRDAGLQRIIGQKISRLECELACAA